MVTSSENIKQLFNSALYTNIFQKAFESHTIQVIAPASGTSSKKIQELKQITELPLNMSSTIVDHKMLFHSKDDEQRFLELKNAILDPKNTIIWTLRGGYGSARLIDELQKLPKPDNEKIFIGYSDNTALHLFFSEQWGWKTIHGSGLTQLLEPQQDPQNYLKITELLTGQTETNALDKLIPLNARAKSLQKLEGKLTGGNLTLVENSIGTSWQINTDNKIVFLEEVGEKGYRVDRIFNHLHQANMLQGAKALILGDFIHEADPKEMNFVLNRFAECQNFPVYKTNEFGHGIRNYPLRYQTDYEIFGVQDKDYALRIKDNSSGTSS